MFAYLAAAYVQHAGVRSRMEECPGPSKEVFRGVCNKYAEIDAQGGHLYMGYWSAF
jgi:hypothetical protein